MLEARIAYLHFSDASLSTFLCFEFNLQRRIRVRGTIAGNDDLAFGLVLH